jgi:hypothetical protein
MPHILSFMNESYETIFEVLQTDPEVAPLLGPFQSAAPPVQRRHWSGCPTTSSGR